MKKTSLAPLSNFSRKLSTSSLRQIVHIPEHSDIFAFGAAASIKEPLVRDVSWIVNEGEAWAVVSGAGGGGKSAVFKTLLGHTRIAPPSLESQAKWAESGGLYPFLSSLGGDPYTRVSHVSFRQRSGGESGAFFDYTTRYGAMREEEDRITLRDTLPRVERARQPLFDALVQRMNLTSLLNLPIITLSNGQTRRSRIVKAILDQPELLLLDEPLTGLDLPSRKSLLDILQSLHGKSCPRIIMGIRHGEEIPSWITHVLEISGGYAKVQSPSHMPVIPLKPRDSGKSSISGAQGERVLIDLQQVNVSYGDRKIIKNINWTIKEGERWHLQGANGSGKTTLLALITGDHPQSYVQKHLKLPTITQSTSDTSTDTHRPRFSLQHRKRIPSAHLRTLIGVVSPEMYDAFPRRHPGMSVWEAVGTGFDGGFVPRTKGATSAQLKLGGMGHVDISDEELGLGMETLSAQDIERKRDAMRDWRIERCWEVLECLGPAAWSQSDSTPSATLTQEFAQSSFASLSPGEQRLVLLMRALVGKPPVILLDEAWSGMDDTMIAAARRYLRGERADGRSGVGRDQAVIAITHWEDEVPWTPEEVKVLKL